MSTSSRRAFNGAMVASLAGVAVALPARAQDDAECAAPVADQASDDANYVVVRRWKLKPDVDYAEFARIVKDGYVPIIQKVEGFITYYFANPGEGQHMAVAVFASEQGAADSTAAAEEWVAANIADMVDGPPLEVTEAEIWIEATPEDVSSRA